MKLQNINFSPLFKKQNSPLNKRRSINFTSFDKFEHSKEKNNEKLNAIKKFIRYSPHECSPQRAKVLVEKYCKDENGNYDLEKTGLVSSVFGICGNVLFDELDKIYKIILKDNSSSEIDFEKARFVCNAYVFFNEMIINEIPLETNIEMTNAIEDMKVKMSSIIMQNCKQKDSINYKQACKTLDIWVNYVNENKNQLNNSIKIKVLTGDDKKESKPLSIQELTELNHPIHKFFNTDFYRLYRVLTP